MMDEATLKKIQEQQEHFTESPDLFIDAIKSVDFPVRKSHLPNNGWKTRFMSSTSVSVGANGVAAADEALILAQQHQLQQSIGRSTSIQ
jgi:hypothetical protein